MATLIVRQGGAEEADEAPRPVSLGAARRLKKRQNPAWAAEMNGRLHARMVREMNRLHAVVDDRSITIAHAKRDATGRVYVAFRSEAELELLYRNLPLLQAEFAQDRNGTVYVKEWKRKSRVTAWLSARGRRDVYAIENQPQPWGAPPLPSGILNVWPGYGIIPAPAGLPLVGGAGHDAAWPVACRLILQHIYEVWCSGDRLVFRWLISWMAQMVQDPAELTGTFVVLQGGQGTGKGIIIHGVLGRILGAGFVQIADKRYLVGNFNSILQGKTLIFADELFVRDPEAKNSLKNKVSEPTILIEYKRREPYEIRNTSRIIMASNEKHIIDAERDDRRAAVLKVSEHRKVTRDMPDDHPNRLYFNALGAEAKGDGPSAFFRFLLEWDYSDVDLRMGPTTPALVQQKLHSLPLLPRWWFERLTEGVLLGAADATGHEEREPWPKSITKPRLFASVERFSERMKASEYKRPTFDMVSQFITDPEAPVGLKRNGEREGSGSRDYIYTVPPLDEARRRFAEWLACPVEMIPWQGHETPYDGCSDPDPDPVEFAAGSGWTPAASGDEAIPF